MKYKPGERRLRKIPRRISKEDFKDNTGIGLDNS
jgi:hypothetical protein